LPLIHQII